MLRSFGEISFLQVDGFSAVVGHGAEMPDDDEYTGGLMECVKKRKPALKNGNKLKSKKKNAYFSRAFPRPTVLKPLSGRKKRGLMLSPRGNVDDGNKTNG